jgi:RNA polymerase sigma-70 factor (ECF subfamily)
MSPKEFAERVEPHLGMLHRLARRLTRSRAEAEDLAQEGLLRAFERRASLRDPAKIRSWLLALLRNLHLNRVRDAKPHLVVLSGGAGFDEPTGDLEEEIQSRALSDELLLALRDLPEEQATALWLRAVEGLSYEEIAEVMETPVGTVRSRLSRAREGMLARLRRDVPSAMGGRR